MLSAAVNRTGALNVAGAVLAGTGTVLALLAYSGDRVYDLSYLGVAVAGGTLILAGVGILAIVRASTDKAGRRAGSLLTAPAPLKEVYRTTLRCPGCGNVFTHTGPRPGKARCPACGTVGATG